MNLPFSHEGLDYTKFKNDKDRLLNALDKIAADYGSFPYAVANQKDREGFLLRLIGTWARESRSHDLNYSFNSYFFQAKITYQWLEDLHTQSIKSTIITRKEFIPLLRERFIANLAKYEPKEAKP